MAAPGTSKSRRPIIAIALMAVALGLGLAVLWARTRPQTVPVPPNGSTHEKSSIAFRLKWLIYAGFAPHFVALEKGYFAAQNLDVRIDPGGPGVDPLKLVLTGDADVGLASYDQILIARENGLPLIAIAEDTTKSGVGFMSLASSGIKKPEDFIGRKVGVMPGTDKGTMYEAMMAKQHIDRSRVQEIPVQFNLQVLLTGTVEVFPAFITNQPIQARAAGFDVAIVDPADYGIVPGGNVFFTSESNLKTKREHLLRFLRAELRAIADCQAMDNGAVVDCVIKHNDQLKRSVEINIWQATKSMLLEKDRSRVGLMKRATWEHTATLFRDSGVLKRNPDLDECFTNDLVEQVHREGL